MDFHERIAMRPVLWMHLSELTGDSFEDFFHDVMAATNPGFVDVRTHGALGDKSSDGLCLHGRKLYACYAPPVPDAAKTIAKFKSDLAGAEQKRKGEFDTFVFVHNDVKGIHPELSSAMAEESKKNPGITIELMGRRHFRDFLNPLDVAQVESLLQNQIPLSHVTHLGLEELEELLAQLEENREPAELEPDILTVSDRKLSYSRLDPDTQAEMRDAMKCSPQIDRYYASRSNVSERDEVAARFNREYNEATEDLTDPESILDRLTDFLLGNRTPSRARLKAANAILAYFFQSCDIFEDAPPDWKYIGERA